MKVDQPGALGDRVRVLQRNGSLHEQSLYLIRLELGALLQKSGDCTGRYGGRLR
jgi:hypothetical protein